MPGTSGALHWSPLGLSRVIAILHNPTYAGAYVYGRRRSHPVIVERQRIRVRTLPRPPEQWTVHIPPTLVVRGVHHSAKPSAGEDFAER
jgi:hypothetical protein